MSSVEEGLEQNVTRHLGAISLCLEKHYRMPALALIYCGVDIFSALGRPQSQQEATRKDFLDWCDRYLLPDAKLNCNSIDLYAARCAILHTYTSKSAISRKGGARQIVYAWGNKTSKDLEDALESVKMSSGFVVIQIETLALAFEKAVRAFILESISDSEQKAVLYTRAREFFIDSKRII